MGLSSRLSFLHCAAFLFLYIKVVQTFVHNSVLQDFCCLLIIFFSFLSSAKFVPRISVLQKLLLMQSPTILRLIKYEFYYEILVALMTCRSWNVIQIPHDSALNG